ncbi:MAG: hypothetical protein MJA84_00640 [Firmicutes bacterium]|nr:hypothetical protein [Bacillota bacterium]
MEKQLIPGQIKKVLIALEGIRTNIVMDEYSLQEMIAQKLTQAGIPFSKEHRLGPRNRIDFLTAGGVGIEVKKGKPYKRQVIGQLNRYAENPEITVIVLVVERNLDIPKEINGKPCFSFGLNKLWGIAL